MCHHAARGWAGARAPLFADKAEAHTFLELRKREGERHGLRALSLGEQARADYLWCEAQLKPYALTVRQAVQTLLPQLQAREHGLTVPEGVKRLLASKRAVGLGERFGVSHTQAALWLRGLVLAAFWTGRRWARKREAHGIFTRQCEAARRAGESGLILE